MLKKLDKEERQVMKKNKNLKPCFVFQLIKSVADKNPFKNIIAYLCKSAGVSKSGYYNYISSEHIRNEREKMDLESRDLILKVFNRRGYKKGSRSIKMILEREFNIIYSLKKIRRIMKKYGIECPHRKPNQYRKMAKATKEHRVVENKLKREFKQDIPGKVLLTDITYLSTIKDSSTNEILAYNVSDSLAINLVLDTIHKLNNNKRVNLVEGAYIQTKVHIILVLSFKVY